MRNRRHSGGFRQRFSRGNRAFLFFFSFPSVAVPIPFRRTGAGSERPQPECTFPPRSSRNIPVSVILTFSGTLPGGKTFSGEFFPFRFCGFRLFYACLLSRPRPKDPLFPVSENFPAEKGHRPTHSLPQHRFSPENISLSALFFPFPQHPS